MLFVLAVLHRRFVRITHTRIYSFKDLTITYVILTCLREAFFGQGTRGRPLFVTDHLFLLTLHALLISMLAYILLARQN